MSERTIRVKALCRVEGEGGLLVRLKSGTVEEVRLEIYEPPRLFEALLAGRPLEDVPDITARICGICPVAYQMSSVHALEAALGVTVPAEIRRLRRLLYCGEWIESHALHMVLLHAPDFLGYDSGLEMAKDFPEAVERGLRLKKYGNQLLAKLGGRSVHPVNVAVGGFYRVPRSEELAPLIANFQWGLEAASEMLRWVAAFDFPDFDRRYDFVSLVHPDEYPMNEGRITSSDGTSLTAAEYETTFEEFQVPHSTALHSRRKSTGGIYLVGPLARVNLNLQRLSPVARRLADEVGIDWPSANPYQSIVARGLEVVHAFDEALAILRDLPRPKSSRVSYTYREASGAAATEAPRGLLYHRYDIDAAGAVRQAKIVPPTSQNQSQIEDDLRQLLPRVLPEGDEPAARGCERLVRSYDPCISCATHFLKLKIQRD